MADNSNNRKKTLFVSVLLFLAAGGGVFLFMVIQGSNDLTKGKNNNFTYGAAAREGVSSFFKYIGGSFDDEKAMAKHVEAVEEARELQVETGLASSPDISDWLKPRQSAASAPVKPTAVPKMGGGGLSGGVGGGGGGSRSSGGVSRFGEGGNSGNTKISAATGAGGGLVNSKGAIGSLANARAVIGEGLRSGSAMTAKTKWDSSFGVGHTGKGSELAYGKGGLVNLDGIKKGEIDNLKVKDAKSLKVTEPGEFQQDKEAESKDAVLAAAKKTAEDAAKKAAAEALAKSAASGLSGSSSDGNSAKPGGSQPNSGAPTPPDAVTTFGAASICAVGCPTTEGGTLKDLPGSMSYASNPDGTWTVTHPTTYTLNGVTYTGSQSVVVNADGTQKGGWTTSLGK